MIADGVKCVTERDRQLNMVFTTAIEGGINYWARVDSYNWAVPDSDGFQGISEGRNFNAAIVDDEGKSHTITRAVIVRGISRAYQYMRENVAEYDSYQRHAISDLNYGHWDDVDYDATTADIVVQFGLFNELVYG